MDKTMGSPILQELHLKLLVVMVNRIEEATGFSAETTSSMIFLCSIGPIVGKHLAQAGVNWFLRSQAVSSLGCIRVSNGCSVAKA
jgi:hypothetical protein